MKKKDNDIKELSAEVYKEFVQESRNGTLKDYPDILQAIVGMNGEAGECIDLIKKSIFHGHEFNVNHFLNELGDVSWYIMLFCIEKGFDTHDIFNKCLERERVKVDKHPLPLALDYIIDLNYRASSISKIQLAMPKSTILILDDVRTIFYDIKMSANIFGTTIEHIFWKNKVKHNFRYPNGFNKIDSINRSDNL